MRSILPLLGVITFLAILALTTLYSFKRCGWGMFAYENPFIAAITGECAQQQREQYPHLYSPQE